MDSGEKKALADIEKFGCHIIHVIEEGDSPPFSYSVGITRASDAPEVVVIGLEREISHFVVNEYNRRVRDGERFAPGVFYLGFLDAFAVVFEQVHRRHYREYFGWDLWLYGDDRFDVLQLVYPTTSGLWPWDASAPSDFKAWQPLLTASGGREPG